MPSGYTVTGRGDLDGLFMARVSAARANVGYTVAGVDLAQRYEPIGSVAPIAATGFKSAGTDLASLFRAISPLVTLTASSSMAGVAAGAMYELQFGGDVFATQGNNTTVDVGDWVSPKANLTNYQVLATLVSGTLTAGTVGSWLSLGSSTRQWFKQQSSIGTLTAVIDIQIRRASDSVIVSPTARITLQATRTS